MKGTKLKLDDETNGGNKNHYLMKHLTDHYNDNHKTLRIEIWSM